MSHRWTYQVVEVKPSLLSRVKAENIQAELNRLGAQGWELVNFAFPGPMAPATLVLKKPQ
ncbi:DUF4177 domain-containing protein [Luteimonas suaedae]|uniref:DUF4177 domain-containing protein n=1 Tax=Luteimonas suaedae TaxID=2605430 RepID=UPI0011EF148B|nr:DUF4177 domain-containing protein [Luteimonas suaedae]